MDFRKISFKAQKSPYLHKTTLKPMVNNSRRYYLLKPMVQAHGISSHFQLIIQAHESHRGNFGSCGLEDQEVCLVKL